MSWLVEARTIGSEEWEPISVKLRNPNPPFDRKYHHPTREAANAALAKAVCHAWHYLCDWRVVEVNERV
jgi:hypothetical protein